MKTASALAAILLAAAALRLPRLADRPMHADEAVQADRFATLLTEGDFQYNPSDFHGPVLLLAGLPAAWAFGLHRLADLNETILRAVPAVAGLAVVALSFRLALPSGYGAALAAATLTAVSPGLVYFSRSYIAEMPLVCATAILVWGFFRYRDRPSVYRAGLMGVAAGVAYAAKETAVLSFAATGIAMAVLRWSIPWRHALAALGTASAAAGLLLSSFGRRPGALSDALAAPWLYAQRSLGEGAHAHPVWFYLQTNFESGEGWVIVGSLAGAVVLWRRSADVRFWAVYSIALLVLYSVLRYKTPWSSLSLLHGFLILGGIVAGSLCRSRVRIAAVAIVAVILAWQAFRLSYLLAVDSGNPWVYAQTSNDVFAIADRVKRLALPEGRRIQIVTAENFWPLPWYLRRVSSVEWSREVPRGRPPAPVILTTPALEAEIAEYLYANPRPEGQSLYVNVFAQPVYLRPGVEVRGYALASLKEELSQ